MILYKAEAWSQKIEVSELTVTKQTDKRYYIDSKRYSYIDKCKVDTVPSTHVYIAIAYSFTKEKAIELLKQYYKNEITRLNSTIKHYEKIINSENS